MGVVSLALATLHLLSNDADRLRAGGLFQGYTPLANPNPNPTPTLTPTLTPTPTLTLTLTLTLTKATRRSCGRW